MATARVAAETTIARALAADPELVDRLVAFDPAFRKLKNPILRRTMARIANFADAARVAGVPLDALLAVANGVPRTAQPAVAPVGGEAAAASAASPPDWVVGLDRAVAVRLDVRPVLESGSDPFATIMGVVAKLASDAVLVLEAPFDPAPLRRVLAGKGYADHAECLAPTHWRVYFRKGEQEVRPGAAAVGARIWQESGIDHIDVRGLVPPEPMIAILRLIDRPDCGASVVVHHEREPVFLYPELAERRWRHEIVEGDLGEVRLRLTRAA